MLKLKTDLRTMQGSNFIRIRIFGSSSCIVAYVFTQSREKFKKKCYIGGTSSILAAGQLLVIYHEFLWGGGFYQKDKLFYICIVRGTVIMDSKFVTVFYSFSNSTFHHPI